MVSSCWACSTLKIELNVADWIGGFLEAQYHNHVSLLVGFEMLPLIAAQKIDLLLAVGDDILHIHLDINSYTDFLLYIYYACYCGCDTDSAYRFHRTILSSSSMSLYMDLGTKCVQCIQ